MTPLSSEILPDFHSCSMCSMVMVAKIVSYGNHGNPGNAALLLLECRSTE